ncbi:uncharacterized protein CLUP02_05468 [Colletotrichum lupini]|uniref:Uncharacterized protein n=1 Tax=Colletotrichum lupini TaxID=145971 RepID=A0A9Q8WEN0_9PEZI|nr:uncharacterized protein CLUP02_05468 [Colletotrichum lupini]UQC79987.1 hypothetical protein CLUP02_05468 [Colletotrichum lupini]
MTPSKFRETVNLYPSMATEGKNDKLVEPTMHIYQESLQLASVSTNRRAIVETSEQLDAGDLTRFTIFTSLQ